MDKKWKILLLIFVLAIVMRVIFFDTSYFMWDESVYLLNAKLISGETVGYEETFLRPPLLPLIISPFTELSEQGFETASKILVILLNSLIVIPVYILGSLLNKKTALLSGLIIALLPVSIFNSRLMMTDHLGALLALSSFLCYLLWSLGKSDKLGYLGAILLGLSILMKFTNLLVILLIFPIMTRMIKKDKINELLISFLLILGTLSPYLLFSYIRYGNPLYTLWMALHVVSESDPVSLRFIMAIFIDTFGLFFLMLAIIGTILLGYRMYRKYKNKKQSFAEGLLLYSFLMTFIYFIYIASRGTAKPPGIEWEIERFMLLLAPLMIIITSFSITSLTKKIKSKKVQLVSLILVLILGFSLLIPQFTRAYTPQIEFEEGLRYATRDMADLIRTSDIKEVACIDNCPPIAYYSGKKVEVFYSEDNLFDSGINHIVSFSELESPEDKKLIKKMCKEDRCAYLYKRVWNIS